MYENGTVVPGTTVCISGGLPTALHNKSYGLQAVLLELVLHSTCTSTRVPGTQFELNSGLLAPVYIFVLLTSDYAYILVLLNGTPSNPLLQSPEFSRTSHLRHSITVMTDSSREQTT